MFQKRGQANARQEENPTLASLEIPAGVIAQTGDVTRAGEAAGLQCKMEYLRRVAHSAGIEVEDPHAASERILTLSARTCSLARLARLTYLKSSIVRPDSTLVPLDSAFLFLALRTDSKDGQPPVSIDRLIQKHPGKDLSVELLGVTDKNSLFVQGMIGRPAEPLVAALQEISGASRQKESEGLTSIRIDTSLFSPDKLEVSKGGPLQRLLAKLDEREEALFLSDLRRTIEGVFGKSPPADDDRIYELAAAAVLHGEVHGIHAELSWAQDLPLEQRSTLKFLVDESEQTLRLGPGGGASRINEFLDVTFERPFKFEDLFAAATIVRVLSELRLARERQVEIAIAIPDGAAFGQQHFACQRQFRAALLSARDLREMGVKEPVNEARILHDAAQAQALGFLKTRPAALDYACHIGRLMGEVLAGSGKLVERSGAELRDFVKAIPTELEVWAEYKVQHFRPQSRMQFLRDELPGAVLRELKETQNYPKLKACGMKPDEVASLFTAGRARNLVELEAFCANLQELKAQFGNIRASLSETADTASNAALFARVERPKDPELRSIAVCLGYQSGDDYGMGVRHFMHQRIKDGSVSSFALPGEGEEEANQRFIRTVLHVAGTGTVKVPSRLFPDTHLLLSAPTAKDRSDYLTLVLARVPDPLTKVEERKWQVVTALYHSSGKVLRRCLANELRGWVKKERELRRLNPTGARGVLAAVNALLNSASQREIDQSEIGICEERHESFDYSETMDALGSLESGEFGDAKGFDAEAIEPRMRASRSLAARVRPPEPELEFDYGYVFNPAARLI